MKIKLIFILLACISNFSYSFEFFDEKLQAFDCSSENEAKACSKCKIAKSSKIDLKINQKNSSVLEQGYQGKDLVGSTLLEKCKIIDKSNWECGEGFIQSDWGTSNRKQGMNNGIYYIISELTFYVSKKINHQVSIPFETTMVVQNKKIQSII
ncbi:hypothetical protein [Limnohabitans sp. Jir72]|uniref:hypothetical protein n=1 Tax=Limnohabitans sp. Jir72 TaxID=1977909 RepID=UPI0011B1E64D|nr:hypothetical protein [Limnohabitans sp. Jir72]